MARNEKVDRLDELAALELDELFERLATAEDDIDLLVEIGRRHFQRREVGGSRGLLQTRP